MFFHLLSTVCDRGSHLPEAGLDHLRAVQSQLPEGPRRSEEIFFFFFPGEKLEKNTESQEKSGSSEKKKRRELMIYLFLIVKFLLGGIFQMILDDTEIIWMWFLH